MAGRRREIREAVAASSSDPVHRAQVPGAPVLLQDDRRRADRRFPRGDAGVAIGPIGAEGVPHAGAHRSVRGTTVLLYQIKKGKNAEKKKKEKKTYAAFKIHGKTRIFFGTDASTRKVFSHRAEVEVYLLPFPPPSSFYLCLFVNASCDGREERPCSIRIESTSEVAARCKREPRHSETFLSMEEFELLESSLCRVEIQLLENLII